MLEVFFHALPIPNGIHVPLISQLYPNPPKNAGLTLVSPTKAKHGVRTPYRVWTAVSSLVAATWVETTWTPKGLRLSWRENPMKIPSAMFE